MAQYFDPAAAAAAATTTVQSASHPYSDGYQGQQSQMYLPPHQGPCNPNYPSQQSLCTPNQQQQQQPQSQLYGNAAPPLQPFMLVGENASYYGTAPTYDQYGRVVSPADPEGEKGLGSTLLGGAAGGYAGHKLGGGLLGSTAGALIGAVGMNAVTHQIKDGKKKHGKYGKHGKYKKQHGCKARRRRRYSSSSSSDSD